MYIDKFVDYIQFHKRYSKHTILACENDLKKFFEIVNTNEFVSGIDTVDVNVIRKTISLLKKGNSSSRSINRLLSILRTFFKYLTKEKIIATNPMDKIPLLKVAKNLPKFVRYKEICTLFENSSIIFPDNFKGMRNRLILELFYCTGIRLSELLSIQETDIDLKRNVIKILGKRSKGRYVPFFPEISKSISQYIAAKKQYFSSNYLFLSGNGNKMNPRSVYYIVNKHLSMISNSEKKSPHILRHTFATHMANGGAELNTIKEILGHSSLIATQIYLHSTIEYLQNSYKFAHPRE